MANPDYQYVANDTSVRDRRAFGLIGGSEESELTASHNEPNWTRNARFCYYSQQIRFFQALREPE
jgi:hypothetical protein